MICKESCQSKVQHIDASRIWNWEISTHSHSLTRIYKIAERKKCKYLFLRYFGVNNLMFPIELACRGFLGSNCVRNILPVNNKPFLPALSTIMVERPGIQYWIAFEALPATVLACGPHDIETRLHLGRIKLHNFQHPALHGEVKLYGRTSWKRCGVRLTPPYWSAAGA